MTAISARLLVSGVQVYLICLIAVSEWLCELPDGSTHCFNIGELKEFTLEFEE